jgi:hypothetical protein
VMCAFRVKCAPPDGRGNELKKIEYSTTYSTQRYYRLSGVSESVVCVDLEQRVERELAEQRALKQCVVTARVWRHGVAPSGKRATRSGWRRLVLGAASCGPIWRGGRRQAHLGLLGGRSQVVRRRARRVRRDVGGRVWA